MNRAQYGIYILLCVAFLVVHHIYYGFQIPCKPNSVDDSSSLRTGGGTGASKMVIHGTTGGVLNFDRALHDSYGFFDDIDNDQWRIRREIIKSSQWFNNPHMPEYRIEQLHLWMMDNVHPMLSCPYEKRIGGMPDGGKWACDPIRLRKVPDCLVYSVGSNGQHEFEDGIVDIIQNNKHCEIHVFDPEPRYERDNDIENKNIHYHAYGISSSTSKTEQFGDGSYVFKNFREIAKELGHTGKKIDIFKIDCEGCEWTSYDDMLESYDIRQLLIEIHPNMLRPDNVKVSDLFTEFRDYGFIPFSKEANTWEHGSGVYEYSFIRLMV